MYIFKYRINYLSKICVSYLSIFLYVTCCVQVAITDIPLYDWCDQQPDAWWWSSSCYRIIKPAKSRDTGQTCKNSGERSGHFAYIISRDQAKYLAYKIHTDFGYGEVWIGNTKSAAPTSYRKLIGYASLTKNRYVPFYPNEPDNSDDATPNPWPTVLKYHSSNSGVYERIALRIRYYLCQYDDENSAYVQRIKVGYKSASSHVLQIYNDKHLHSCATFCVKDKLCLSFAHSKVNKTCEMYRGAQNDMDPLITDKEYDFYQKGLY